MPISHYFIRASLSSHGKLFQLHPVQRREPALQEAAGAHPRKAPEILAQPKNHLLSAAFPLTSPPHPAISCWPHNQRKPFSKEPSPILFAPLNMRSGPGSITALGSEPLDGFALSPELQAAPPAGSALPGHATRLQHSSALYPPDEHLGVSLPSAGLQLLQIKIFLSLPLSFSLSLVKLHKPRSAVARSPRSCVSEPHLLCDSTSPLRYRREPCVPVFPQASPLFPGSSPRKFSFCWHQCGRCNCS